MSDDRAEALMSVVRKCFERLVHQHLKVHLPRNLTTRALESKRVFYVKKNAVSPNEHGVQKSQVQNIYSTKTVLVQQRTNVSNPKGAPRKY